MRTIVAVPRSRLRPDVRIRPTTNPDAAVGLYTQLADLALDVADLRVEPLEQTTPGGWSRTTTSILLRGGSEEGAGEDVIWTEEEHRLLRRHSADLPVTGRYTLHGFSRQLDEIELFTCPPSSPDFGLYRRWAFESAALDLALRQAGMSLAEALGIEPAPLRFVKSIGLGEPATSEPLRKLLELYPWLRFKVDFSSSWTAELIDELAELGVVDTVDLKGLYRGDFSGPPADAELYQLVAEGLPDAWLEDPELDGETEAALAPHRHRITWDANLHSLADIVTLPFEPRCINVKPSRFGFLSELLRTYEYCTGRGIAMYSGGQFELGAGRGQAQYLASLFHADAPNDIAPRGYNRPELAAGLPASPMPPAPSEIGFRWTDDEA
jgi:hypothetical protein